MMEALVVAWLMVSQPNAPVVNVACTGNFGDDCFSTKAATDTAKNAKPGWRKTLKQVGNADKILKKCQACLWDDITKKGYSSSSSGDEVVGGGDGDGE